MHLNFDVDVPGGGTENVYEEVYSRAEGTTAWELLATTSAHTVTGTTEADAQSYPVIPAGSCEAKDYMVEVYLVGGKLAEDSRTPDNDPYLRAHREESFQADVPPAAIYNAWWTQTADQDQDGCNAPENGSVFDEVELGRRRLRRRRIDCLRKDLSTGGGQLKWVLLATTSPHSISGNSSLDAQFLDIAAARDLHSFRLPDRALPQRDGDAGFGQKSQQR